MSKIKEKLNNNLKQMSIIDNKLKIIKANSFESKLMHISFFTIISFVIILLNLVNIMKLGFINVNLLQPLMVTVPVVLGLISESVFMKKTKWKQRLRSFSKSKKYDEILEEETRLQIDKERLFYQNKVLKKCNNIAKNNLPDIDKMLQDKTRSINNLAASSILINKFWIIRDKKCAKEKMVINILVGLVIAATLSIIGYLIPTVIISIYTNNLISLNYLPLISSTFIAGFVSAIYTHIKRKKQKKVFNNINKEYLDNALSLECSDNEEETFKNNLANTIDSLSITKKSFNTKKEENIINNDISFEFDDSEIIIPEVTPNKSLGKYYK